MAKLGEYGYKLETMTALEVFDVAAEHLLTQGVKSSGADGKCAYNGGGICCAAAPFIRDYNANCEHKTWDGLVEGVFASSNHRDLIRFLQMVHDGSMPDEWQKRLKELAELLELNHEILSNF